MGIAGSVSDDLKWFYPDKTGFMFDTPPMNVASGRGAYSFGVQQDWRYYGGRYLSIPWNKSGGKYSDESEHVVSQYNGVLNWLNKYEIDNRFLSFSDKNANLNQFPEVQYPWKFTEYVFTGMGSGYEVVEPPLYDPATLMVVNGVENPPNVNLLEKGNEHLRKEGKLDGYGYEDIHYEPVYYYRCKFNKTASDDKIENNEPVLGPLRKQYEPDKTKRDMYGDLESGLIVNGKVYPPWTEPEAHPRYKHTFINTQELCGVKRVFKFMKPNRGASIYYTSGTVQGDDTEHVKHTGIRLYRKDILAKCVDIGQHGNIPPFTINMSAPKDYIEPQTMYRNTVEVVTTYEAGQAMYATDDGIISYDGVGTFYLTDISIAGVTDWTEESTIIPGKSGNEWSYKMHKPKSLSPKKIQPKPSNFGIRFKEKCYASIPGDIQSGELIHKGCPFFVGNSDGCYCSVKRDLLESGKNPLTHPNEFMGIFGDKIEDSEGNVLFDPGVESESPISCMSYSSSSQEEPIGSICKMYAQQGPREILVFMCDEMSNEEFANSIGFNQGIDTDNQIANSMLGLGVAGLFGWIAVKAFTPEKMEQKTTSLDGMSVRKKVTYKYKEVNLDGKKMFGQQTRNNDTRDVVAGSGKFAFDKYDTSAIGGVDTNIFTGTNLLNRTRFCSSVMQCYNAKYCNKIYGPLNLSSGQDDLTFAGVGSDNHYCRYYNGGCPTTEIHQRAREYDREYRRLLNLVLSVFRASGISAFSGLSEVQCGNVFAAVGNCKELDSIVSVPGSHGNIYFIYDKPSSDSRHKSANVFGFITQYPAPSEGSSLPESSYYKMNRKKYPLMSILPSCFGSTSEIPWLVKLHDDYVSPTKFESYVTNLRRFIGGRMPEYKDFSKMGEEIQCTVTEIQEGYDGSLTSGKGGSDEHNDYTTSTSYQYYRVDASGEWVVEPINENGDGISTGTDSDDARKHGQARASLPPSHSNGATPIKGSYVNSSYTQEKGMIKAIMTQGWCFSNDNRTSLETDTVTVDDGVSDEPKEIPNAKPPDNCLPLERDWYYCPKCSPKPYSYHTAPEYYNSIYNLNAHGEPNINQIFTDFEYQQYGKCPRCGEPLVRGGKMKHFAKCRAQGIVNYFGLPGELVDMSGFYWKNHTEMNRTFVSEVLSKNGSILNGIYKRNDSATAATESAVEKNFGRGENYIKGYLSESGRLRVLESGENSLTAKASEYMLTNSKASEHIYAPSFLRNNIRMDGLGVYHDRYISPYPTSKEDHGSDFSAGLPEGALINNGMEFISSNMIKSLRNMVMPWQAFPCYDVENSDYISKKQGGFKNRFTEKDKYFANRRKGLPSIILASNQSKTDLNYVQFWDGTLIPGKTVRAYYPTSPLWWYRHDAIGGITRYNGQEDIHFNMVPENGGFGGSNEFGYGGNVVTASFHSIQGWLPLDKQVERAILSFGMSYQPDCPPVGRTSKGGPMHDKHWHSFTSYTFENGMGQKHADYDKKMLDDVMGWSDDVVESGLSGGSSLSDGSYIPINYNGMQYTGGDNVISQYSDDTFGFGITQSWLEWGGFGEDIVQKVTEESIWKKYTFEEFKNIENQYIYDVDFEIGNPTEPESVRGTVSYMPKSISDGLINNIGQGITNMFNFSGLNNSGLFNKDGMDIAEKSINSDWAEGGQIIIQDDSGTVINRDVSALGASQEIDVTSLVKKYYNERISRDFIAKAGLAYNEIWGYIDNNKVKYNAGDGLFDKHVNYRHYNQEIGGYWLNSMAFYPELEDGEFPTIDEGMEYVIKPLNICDIDACGSFKLENLSKEDDELASNSSSSSEDYTKSNPEYYKFSPHALCFHDSEGKPSAGKFDNDFNVTTGDWSKCIMTSNNINDLYFVMNISGYPTQTSHRPYRNEPGSYNYANAICPNPNCLVHMDNRTVSEAAAVSNAGKTGYKNYLFNLYSDKCGACGTSLSNAPGVLYTGGDGIETWEYRDVPKKDCIVNGFIIDIDNTLCRCGFDVYGMSSADSYWEKLITVDYDYDSGTYLWNEYSGLDFITKSGTSLPVFKGVWRDGYNAAGNSLSGYHFLAKRCNKIKVVGRPCRKKSNGEYLPNGGRIEDVSPLLYVKSSNFIKGTKSAFKTGLSNLSGCEGGKLEIYLNESVVFSSEIRSYNQTTRAIGLANEIPDSIISKFASSGSNSRSDNGGKTNEYTYCVKNSRYIFTVKKFQVYGLELCDNVKITDDANTAVLPIRTGIVSVPLYDNASKLLRVMAVNGNTSMYSMKDMGTNSVVTSDNLYYYAAYDSSSKKYYIYSGEFFYDSFSNNIFLPYKIKDSVKNMVIEEIDNVYTSDLVAKETIPNGLEVKYMTNAGTSVDLDIESRGEGPSYMVERDTITEFVSKGNLPAIGKSVFFRKEGLRVDMDWMVSNKERTKYDCAEPSLTGLELASGVTHSSFKEFIGGDDETENGLNPDKKFLFTGKATGQVTITGLPNSIVSGILYVRAPAVTAKTYNFNGNNVKVIERTGGLRRTGFIFMPKVKVRDADEKGQKLACLAGSKPKLVVYLSERDVTTDLIN